MCKVFPLHRYLCGIFYLATSEYLCYYIFPLDVEESVTETNIRVDSVESEVQGINKITYFIRYVWKASEVTPRQYVWTLQAS